MSGVGDLKNSIESMKRTLIRNGMTDKMNLTQYHFEQDYLKSNNPDIFLKIVDYIMIKHSPLLEAAIVQKFPNIRAQSDKVFMQRCYVCIRQFFDTFPSLTIDQFFSNRFLELKVKFIDELVNLVLFWLNKKSKQSGVNIREQKPEKVEKKKITKYDQEQEPRKISIKPTSFIKQQYSEPYAIEAKPQKPISLKYKPQLSYQVQNQDYKQQFSVHSNHLNKHLNEKPEPIKLKPTKIYQQQSLNYQLEAQQKAQQSQQKQNEQPSSTQSQINDLFQLLGNVSITVNQLVGKFNQFQDNVSTWVKNINAKVDLLDSKVKTIKDNL